MARCLTFFPWIKKNLPKFDLISHSEKYDSLTKREFFRKNSQSIDNVLGGWAGAIPIPLDWDRDWQQWPISCCLGAVAGHIFGNVIAIGRVWPHMASINSGGNKRKFL